MIPKLVNFLIILLVMSRLTINCIPMEFRDMGQSIDNSLYDHSLPSVWTAVTDDYTRPTNVSISESYLDCVNINTEIDKLSLNLDLISDENCNTLYRFPAFDISYEITFKNGSNSHLKVELDLQDSERTSDNTIVTLTGEVIEGYLRGAYFQRVITYPVLNYETQCRTESGVTELQSMSASVTVILTPTRPQNQTVYMDSLRGPQAFDCFGNQSITYWPGLK